MEPTAARAPGALAERFRSAVRHPAAPPLALVALLASAVHLLPRGMPPGLYGLGLVAGLNASLAVVGLLLVYRSDRIINFAHVQLGALGAVLFFEIVDKRQLVRWIRDVCRTCLPSDPELAPRWLAAANFAFALVGGLAVSAATALLVYLLVMRRFRGAPPLVGTVATLGVAQLLATAVERLPRAFGDRAGISGVARPPFDLTVRWPPVVFHAGEVLTVAAGAGVIAGLALFLKRSKAGIAIRATAENPDRAATLGMNRVLVATIVWTVAGLVSGLSGILTAMTTGAAGLGGSGAQTLLRVLAAAAVASMTSFPVAIAASIAIALFDQGFLWSYGGGTLVDLVVFVAVVAVLAARRTRGGHADAEGGSWRAAREVRPIPKELRQLPVVRRWLRWGAGLGVLALLGFPWVFSPSDTGQGSVMLLYAMVGISLLVLTGWAGQISLGQFAFAAVGGFVVSYLTGRAHWPALAAVPAAALAGAVVAVAVGLPALRIRGLYLAVTTLGFAVVTSNVLLNERYGGRLIPATLDRPVVLGLDTGDERVFYYLTLLAAAGCVAAAVGMRRGRTARALIALRDNDRAAQSFGVNLVRARLEAFAVSGLLAAFAGALFAFHQQGVHVGNYAPDASLTMFLLAVIGGLGSVAGPLLGAAYVGGFAIFLQGALSLATATAVLLLLVFVPGGLSQIAYAVRDGLLRRVADRYRIVVPSLVADTRADRYGEYRAPLAPKLLPTGAEAFVPVRYRLPLRPPRVEVSADRQGAGR